VLLLGFSLPLTGTIPMSQWHAHEMIFGTYGAALAGFLTSAVPEWTDTRPRRGRALLMLLLLWLPGRVIGLTGIEALVLLAGATDVAFLFLLFWYTLSHLIERRSTRNVSFAVWMGLFVLVELCIRLAWLNGSNETAGALLNAALMIFIIFFSLAVARINVAVINLALDPSGETTPYRPHPGRQNLAAGMVTLFAVAAFVFPGSAAPAYLALAAAATFFDRLTEWFIGRAVLRTHVLALAAANSLAGAGFVLIGLSRLGAPVSANTGYHVLSVGSLGLAVLSVFIIAGLRHTGRPLRLPWQAHVATGLMLCAGLVRVLPELGVGPLLTGVHYIVSAMLWSASFGLWLVGFLPLLINPLEGTEASIEPESDAHDQSVAASVVPLSAPATACATSSSIPATLPITPA
jgi:uncharacterized protein involved in response to NO